MKPANRVVVNTLVQYIQLILNVIIGLYSVRVILNALGSDDYGIYDVVAGVIAVLSFIRSSLVQTSLRYLSVSIGSERIKTIRETFNNCFWLHLLISIFLICFLEIVGFFLFDEFLNIPLGRINAAKVVYQCMLVTLFLNITISPFTALITAHEKFYYYSFIGILDSLLKLAIAFAVAHTSFDRLIVYANLMVGVSIINSILHITYLYSKYRREMWIGKPAWSEVKGITGFAGWTLLDVMGAIASRQGYAVMLNKFFGTTINASFAISRQVEGHTYTISSSVINAIKPQIMKSYGAGDSRRMLRLALTAGKLGFSMMALFAVPLIVMMPDILQIWLKDVPSGAVEFSQLLVAAAMIEQLTKGLVYAAQATGNIKWFSITVSVCRFIALPLSIVFLFLQMPVITAFYIYFICESFGAFSRVLMMSKISEFRIITFLKAVFFRMVPPFGIAYAICWAMYHYFTHNIISLCTIAFITGIAYCILIYIVGLDLEEKRTIISMINSLKNKIHYK